MNRFHNMFRFAAFAAFAILVAGSSPKLGAQIPYPPANEGIVAPQQTFTAGSTGMIMGYFVGSSAGGEDTVRMFDVTTNTYSPWMFDNKTTIMGTAAAFGMVNVGDRLVFEIDNKDLDDPNGYYHVVKGVPVAPTMASDASLSTDGINHAYYASFSGGLLNGVTYAPASYSYLGMEDFYYPLADLDYNDDQFLFTGLQATPTPVPEPSAFILLGSGALGLAGAVRRRLAA